MPTALSDFDQIDNSTSLSKRTLPNFQTEYLTPGRDFIDAYNAFFAANAYANGVLVVPHRDGIDSIDISTSGLVREFVANQRLYMTVRGLYGCSSLIVISRRGVYMNHMYEVPSFLSVQYDSDGKPSKHWPAPDAVFDHHVSNPLADGDSRIIPRPGYANEHWLPSLRALRANVFDPTQPGGVRAFVLSPRDSTTGQPRYQTRMNDISDQVQNTLGITDVNGIVYDRVDRVAATDAQQAIGKVLFMFDPAQDEVEDPDMIEDGLPMKCQIRTARWNLWIGDTPKNIVPFRSDEWAIAPSWLDEFPIVGPGLQLDKVPSACSHISNTSSASIAASTSGTSKKPTSTPSTFSTVTISSVSSSATSVYTSSGSTSSSRNSVYSTTTLSSSSTFTSTIHSTTATTAATSITSCALYTAAALTFGEITNPAVTGCSCNDEVVVGLVTVSAGFDIYNVVCEAPGSKTFVVSTYITTRTNTSHLSATSTALPSGFTPESPQATPTMPSDPGVVASSATALSGITIVTPSRTSTNTDNIVPVPTSTNSDNGDECNPAGIGPGGCHSSVAVSTSTSRDFGLECARGVGPNGCHTIG
ncbi:hypothetical protein LTR78_010861 [Recurvomyces mirabilis]|uniref:Uncharacterized protein n=1 Tax=Recurvomyces mirabilis TaxID=574656 RepID=A0AAE0TLW8_9PEZI|nr:hypothetical protein LTR78_010861 [Recurvomyces mirabilis]KAK5162371.1 hypothetical protein LTS14_000718 [Recurvomyces mirabilis]